MYKLILLVLCLFNSAYATNNYLKEFYDFTQKYNKDYTHDEVSYRYNTFRKNLDFIRSHENSQWTMDMNEYTDLTFNEFKNLYFGVKNPTNIKPTIEYPFTENINTDTLPTSVDWRTKNAVTPVKNQGMCGSCWAFSTTGSVEGAWVLQGSHTLVSLSEQQLVDCAQSEGNNGCNGGLMDYGFQYIIDNNGICSESSYSYKGTDGTCVKNCSKVASIKGFKDIPAGDEQSLLNAVGTVGPVSVAIEADQQGFQFYSGGVFDATCGTNLDHGVLVVGYGTDNGKDYWIVKNSWGSSWGEGGYIRLVRGKNQCGITLSASYPVV